MVVYTRPMTYPEYQELERTAQASFIQFIDIINHEDSVSFADKEAMVVAYKKCYELFNHNCAMLQDTLDRINPAYQGMTEFRTCGERFYRKEGEWQDTWDNRLSRLDTYLHVGSQVTYMLAYNFNESTKLGAIFLDGAVVWGAVLGQKVNSYHELPALGVNQLLIKLGLLT